MTTIQLIEKFLLDNDISLPVHDFVATTSNIYHGYESEYYDSLHYSIELSKPFWNDTLDDLVNVLSNSQNLKVLDFGCGTGFATAQVLQSELKNKCEKIICYDLSPDMVKVCANKFKNVHNITYLSDQEGFENLKKSTEKIDVILCNALVHHVLDHKELFGMFDELLSENGVLIIGHEPNKNFYQNKFLQTISTIYRFNKKCKNKITRLFQSKKDKKNGKDISLLTYNKLLENGYIQQQFPKYMIQKLVDIHVPMSTLATQPWGELGFDQNFFSTISANRFEVVKQRSYNHIKDQEAYKSVFWRSISRIIEKIYPKDGADSIFVLKKK
jgi:2-polyprenyl-3-methyl-5-hydroxy-6-metoxy-1,4-benzoquinol methylase